MDNKQGAAAPGQGSPPAMAGRVATETIRSHVGFAPSGDGWLGSPELPTAGELLRDQQYVKGLPVNPVDVAWPSKEAYLDAQYNIIRCEAVEGLRFSIGAFRQDPSMVDDKNTCVYTSVHVRGYLMSRLGPLCRIAFSTRRAGKKIGWKLSKRLIPGKLVAFTTTEDKFQKICKVGIVGQRPYHDGLEKNPPEIDIFWADVNEAVIDPDEELVMIESRNGYYEAVRHVLVGLQHAARSTSPLDKYVISCDRSDQPASFISESSASWDLSSLIHSAPRSETGDLAHETALLLNLRESVTNHDIRAGMPDMADSTTLDDSQLSALHRILTKELAIVQGPPGTGKTFTSVSALKIMLDNRQHKDSPIVVSAQTNHALDQLLLLCQDAGAKIMRVGGRTENERMKLRTVYALRKDCKSTSNRQANQLETERRACVRALQALVQDLFTEDVLKPEQLRDAGIITDAQYMALEDESEWETTEEGSIAVWLGDQRIHAEYQKEYEYQEEEAVEEVAMEYEIDVDLDNVATDDDEEIRILGDFIPFTEVWTGKIPHIGNWRKRCEDILDSGDDLWDIQGLRGGVYHVMLSRYRSLHADPIRALLKEATRRADTLKGCRWAKDLNIIAEKGISIVGCTTTGLTKYRGFLAAMNPRTMLIEEAAETKEANLTSALYPSVQQLILVGDHQQLTPHCDIRQLGEAPYNLNVSMFQRLVGMGIPYVMLNRQRRMVPEIRAIVSKFYPKLLDHPLVSDPLQRPPVPGMGDRRAWFFTHNWPEESDADSSKYNQLEAQMITKFVQYLVRNGTKMEQITVLTYYNGQRKLLLRMLRRHGLVSDTPLLNVFTVDSYQGEENDIVILSLVRSPKVAKKWAIGFLESWNRATVAISRARRGFFMFGDKENLLSAKPTSDESYELWAKVWNGFAEQRLVSMGKGLPLTCQNHNTDVWHKTPDDFTAFAAGCSVKCGGELPCGHPCKLTCHPMDHKTLPCLEPCSRVLPCGDKCAEVCSATCSCPCLNFRAQTWDGGVTPNSGSAANPSANTSPVVQGSQQSSNQRGAGFNGRSRGRATQGGSRGRGGHQASNKNNRGGHRGGFLAGNTGPSRAENHRPQPQAPATPGTNRQANKGWQNFTRNVPQHDANTRVAAQGAHSAGAPADPDNNVISDNWRPTALMHGRRVAGPAGTAREHRQTPLLIDTSDNPSVTVQVAPLPVRTTEEASAPRYGFEAEVLGAGSSRPVPNIQSSSSMPTVPLTKEEDPDDWLIDL